MGPEKNGKCFAYQIAKGECMVFPELMGVNSGFDGNCYTKIESVIPMACKPLTAPKEPMCVTDKIDLVLAQMSDK